MHIPYLYKKYHKLHHQFKIPFALENHYVELPELAIFMIPIIIPAILLNVHIYELYLISFLFNFHAGFQHSGYRLPFISKYSIFKSEYHDLHHKLFNYNYSALYPCIDDIFGTLIE